MHLKANICTTNIIKHECGMFSKNIFKMKLDQKNLHNAAIQGNMFITILNNLKIKVSSISLCIQGLTRTLERDIFGKNILKRKF